VEFDRGQRRLQHDDGEQPVSRGHIEDERGQTGDGLCVEPSVLSGQEQHVSSGRAACVEQRQLHMLL